jgi:polyferredoxin
MLRTRLVLGITAVLLAAGTILSRAIRGRKNRKKAKAARTLSLITSLVLLGFALQGCYCPLGTFQYAAAAGTLAVIAGWTGFAILLLPIIHALFFGRVYCGWVCPMGALQEMLGRIPVKGRLPIPAKLDLFLVRFKYFLAVLFTAAVILAARGVLDTRWPSLFCLVDPFHTVFTMFATGILTVAVVLIVLAVFSGRFFCRYFCFYGAILGLACRAGLWTRLCRLGGRKATSCDEPDDSKQSCELTR